jgi:hypothetical protein
VEMVRQDDDRCDLEWELVLRFSESASQNLNVINEQSTMAFKQVCVKNQEPIRNKCTSIIGHAPESSNFSREVKRRITLLTTITPVLVAEVGRHAALGGPSFLGRLRNLPEQLRQAIGKRLVEVTNVLLPQPLPD